MKKRQKRKLSRTFIIMLVVLLSVVTAFAASVTVTYQGSIFSYNSGGGKPAENMHGKFTTSEGKPAFCAEHGLPSPMGDSYGNRVALNKVPYNSAQIRKILYYGYRGPAQWPGFSSSTYNSVYQTGFSGNYATSKTDACGTAVTSMALGRAYGGNGRVYDVSGLAAFESYIASKPDPQGFTAYLLPSGSRATQDLFTWEYNPAGRVRVLKETANNSSLVAECPEHYTLAGAVYGIYANSDDARADRNRILTLTTDSSGKSQEASIKAGSYVGKEITAPKGYKIDPQIYSIIVASGQLASFTSKDAPLFDPLSLKLQKKAAEGADKNLSLEGAEYTVKYFKGFLGEGEAKTATPYRTWVFKTDKNGLIQIEDMYKIGGDELFREEDGTPVGLFGTYTFEETKAPAGFAKTEGIVSLQQIRPGHIVDGQQVVLKDVEDVEKEQTVSITINKVDAETGKNEAQGYGSLAGAKYDVFFYDSIKSEDVKVATLTTDEKGFARYEGGKPGLYKVVETDASKGYIIDKEAHEVKARVTEINTANFNYVVESKETPIKVEVEKTTVDKNGDKITLKGAELQLLDKDKKVIETFTSDKASHVIKGLTPGKYYIRETKTPEGYLPPEGDFEFTVKETGKVQKVEIFNEPIPEIKTAASFDNGNKTAKPNGKLTVVDAFQYKRVVIGTKYLVKGELINKTTGKAVAKAERTFTSEKSNGTLKINFTFDAKDLAGTDLVVTEKLYKVKGDDNKLLATHEDLNDMDQTVCIPSLKTTATDKVDSGKDLNGDEKQTIVDKVEYKNLYPGKEYTVKGTLMNKATGKPVLDNGKEVTSEKKFKAESPNGFVELEFTFNASALKGETVVVFEDIYEGKVNVGTHADIKDIDQSVYIPLIHTTATSQDDGTKSVLPVKSVTVSDKIEYKNLIVGQMYQVEGTLVNKATGKEIVKSSGCFTAEETDGSVTLDFTFDAKDLKDGEVVVFEEIYKLDEEGETVKKVAEHKDIEDEGQTVKIENPKIGTSASFKDGKKEAQSSSKMTVIDTVKYENLVVGKEYIVKGTLMDKESGKAFLDNGKEVTAEKTFTAEKANGSIELEFTFDGSSLSNKELVVFEDIYYGKELIATHSDLKDKDQTVKVVPVPPATKTGDDTEILFYAMLIISALGIFAILYTKKRFSQN